ncbi:MAG: helix-turn-helix domain-containing protein [Bacteroidota bacterium]
MKSHIPHLKKITDFYNQLQIGQPQSDDFAIMRIEDQPDSKRMEMPLFRCNFYRLVFFRNTGVEWNLPNEHFSSSSNSLYFAYPGKLESWVTSQKMYGYLICFTEEFAHINALQSAFDQEFPFFNFNGQSLIKFSEEPAKELIMTQEKLLEEMSTELNDRDQMLRLLLHQYLIQVRRVYLNDQDTLSKEDKNSNTIFNRFRKEVDDYFAELAEGKATEQANVSLIADRINLNPGYLNTTIKNLTGNTASSYIHDKTILESKSYLMHTELQVAEIAYQLGFTNVTYFNRFFKKQTGNTPSTFKNHHQ